MKFRKRFYPRFRLTISVLCVLLLHCWPASLYAQSYKCVEVLPGVDKFHAMISSASKDPLGIFWMVSGGKVYRYDGVRLLPLSKLYGKELPFAEAIHAKADPWGRIWIETIAGMHIFDTHSWRFLTDEDGLGVFLNKRQITVYRNAQRFFVIVDHTQLWEVMPKKAKKLADFIASNLNFSEPVNQLISLDDQHIWYAHKGRLHHYELNTGRYNFQNFPEGMHKRLDDLIAIKGGVLIRNYKLGYYIYDGSTFKPVKISEKPFDNVVNWSHWVLPDQDKVLFFLPNGKYRAFSRDTDFHFLTQGNHLFATEFFSRRVNSRQPGDKEWLLATEKGLLSVFKTFKPFNHLDVGSVRGMQKQGDTYYFGGYGLLRTWKPGEEPKEDLSNRSDNYYDFLSIHPDTSIVALESDFLAYLIKGKIKSAPIHMQARYKSWYSGLAFCVIPTKDRELLVGTYNGLWSYKRDNGELKPLLNQHGEFFTKGMRMYQLAMHRGVLYYACDRGFYRYSRGRSEKLFPKDHKDMQVYDFSIKDNSIYLATKGSGLVIQDLNGQIQQLYTEEEGLGSNIIYQMKWYKDHLFLGTYKGLSVYSNHKMQHFFHTDGLPFEEFNHAASYWDETQQLLFMGGVNGYVYFDPNSLLDKTEAAQAIEPLLTGIHLGQKANTHSDGYGQYQLKDTISLPSDVAVLTMDFAKPNQYRQLYQLYFKVGPLMDDFQEMPELSQINLTGLPAGEYTVEVKAMLTHSKEEFTRQWVIYKKPEFIETPMFYLLLLCFIGTTVLLVLFENGRRIKNDRALRRKISADLHDEVGGLLTGISMQSDLVRHSSLAPRQEHAVETIASYSREAIQVMDDIIWTVDPGNSNLASLEHRMRYLASQLLIPAGFQVQFDIRIKSPGTLSTLVRQNLYLIYKEALHNICKHAAPSTVYIRFRSTDNAICLVVKNEVPQQHEQEGIKRRSYGLKNMQLRAKQIGATFQYSNQASVFEVEVRWVAVKSFWRRLRLGKLSLES